MTRHEAIDTVKAAMKAAGYLPESHRELKRVAEKVTGLCGSPFYFPRDSEPQNPFQYLYREVVLRKNETVKHALQVLALGPKVANKAETAA